MHRGTVVLDWSGVYAKRTKLLQYKRLCNRFYDNTFPCRWHLMSAAAAWCRCLWCSFSSTKVSWCEMLVHTTYRVETRVEFSDFSAKSNAQWNRMSTSSFHIQMQWQHRHKCICISQDLNISRWAGSIKYVHHSGAHHYVQCHRSPPRSFSRLKRHLLIDFPIFA